MPPKSYYVYILASMTGTLYVGLTDNLLKRIWQHKAGTFDGFTKKYEVDRLVYFEVLTDARAGSLRERQIKKYGRKKKTALIEKENPQWKDLSDEIRNVSL